MQCLPVHEVIVSPDAFLYAIVIYFYRHMKGIFTTDYVIQIQLDNNKYHLARFYILFFAKNVFSVTRNDARWFWWKSQKIRYMQFIFFVHINPHHNTCFCDVDFMNHKLQVTHYFRMQLFVEIFFIWITFMKQQKLFSIFQITSRLW